MELNNFGAYYVGEMVLWNTFLLTVEFLRDRLLRKLATIVLGNEPEGCHTYSVIVWYVDRACRRKVKQHVCKQNRPE